MKKIWLFLVVAAIILAGINPRPTVRCAQPQERVTIRPSTSIAPKGTIVRLTAQIKNEGNEETPEGTLIVEVGAEFEIKDTSPPAAIAGNRVIFRFNQLDAGQCFTGYVNVEIVTKIAIVAHPMVCKVSSDRPQGLIKSNCVILLWAPSEYPPLTAELRESGREKGTVRFNLKIIGGFPPYEFYFDWGDGPNGGTGDKKGGLPQEGQHTIEHTYLKPGEYILNGFINDWLGKQVVLRRRLYIIPWEDKP